MKKKILVFCIALISFNSDGQSCNEWIQYVKSKGFGITYYSYSSDAISRVTFYDIYEDGNTYYFAIVVFKTNNYSSFNKEYIYQVSSSTKTYYSMNYLNSAGEAFWNYINPYNEYLGCAPNFN